MNFFKGFFTGQKLNKLIAGLITLILLVLWIFLSQFNFINQAFFPTPSILFKAFYSVKFWNILLVDSAFTLSRLILGIFLGYVICQLLIFVGMLFKPFLTFLGWLTAFLKYTPPPVLIPISILFMGIWELSLVLIVSFCTLIICLVYSFEILLNEEKNFLLLQQSWKINGYTRFIRFFFPIAFYLSYRLIPTLIIWTLSVVLISEIILGFTSGLGSRLLQYQQLYQTGQLFLQVIIILIFAFSLEFLMINFFSRLKWDKLKIFSAICITMLLIASIFFQLTLSMRGFGVSTQKKLVTYSSVVNLPLLVYIEKFNNLNLRLELVSGGNIAMDYMLAGQAQFGGYIDMPNFLAANEKNFNLKIISQVVEKPDHPSLFFISSRNVSISNYQELNNSKVGYYPNNPIIRKGLELVLKMNGASVETIEFTPSNDPSSLATAMIAGQIQGFLSIEPYITQVENSLDLERINPDETLVKGLSFENLPLAALVLNQESLSQDEQKTFLIGIQQSLDFINQNTSLNKSAQGELAEIMKKYLLNTKSKLSYIQKPSEIDPDDLKILINLLKLYSGKEINLNSDLSQYYYNP